ncbi:hypothetical protein ACA910_008961 [Epithemia clementina (nom. ined.)]
MQCPSSPRNVHRSRGAIPSSPMRGRLPATPWSIQKNSDAVADYEVVKPKTLSPGGKQWNNGNRSGPKATSRPAPVTAKSAIRPTTTTPAKSPTKPATTSAPTTTARASASTRSRATTPKPRQSKRTTSAASAKDYQSWNFGKEKKFTKPAATAKNKKAAVTIQRFFRGWWARLKFKLALLQYKLSHKHELTVEAMEQMEKGLEKKKQYERKKLEAAFQAKAKEEKGPESEAVVSESKDIIAYLRKENKKLRDKNDRILKAAFNLKAQNDRLGCVNTQTDGNMGILETHAKQIQETHTKLNHVVPKYKISVAQLSNAAEQHRQYCVVEHSIKLMYVKLIGTIVDMLEERSKQAELTDEIVGYVLAMEGKDNDKPLPEKLPTGDEATELPHPQLHSAATAATTSNGSNSRLAGSATNLQHPYHNNPKSLNHHHHDDDDSDSEDYDEYSVATFD